MLLKDFVTNALEGITDGEVIMDVSVKVDESDQIIVSEGSPQAMAHIRLTVMRYEDYDKVAEGPLKIEGIS